MSAAQRMPVVAGTLGVGALAVLLLSSSTARNAIGMSTSGGIWRLLAIAFALLNVKNLPFVWHYRVFRHLAYQFYFAPHLMEAPHLFKPVITSSYNSITDCDYNLHKSNSTYFADFDAARSALMGTLLRKSLARLNAGDMTGLPAEAHKTKGGYIIALGAVGAVFRKEIKPLESFDIWTRLLTWDEKWMYVISHAVKKGAVKPSKYFLQPWKNGSKKSSSAAGNEPRDMIKSVFATSIAKYVVKKGRLTIAPEIVLTRSDLLPPKPSALSTPVCAIDTPATGTATPVALSSPESFATEVSNKLGIQQHLDDAAPQKGSITGEAMTWEEVENERLRGLEIAKGFDAISALHAEFGTDDEVLGKYPDMFFW